MSRWERVRLCDCCAILFKCACESSHSERISWERSVRFQLDWNTCNLLIFRSPLFLSVRLCRAASLIKCLNWVLLMFHTGNRHRCSGFQPHTFVFTINFFGSSQELPYVLHLELTSTHTLPRSNESFKTATTTCQSNRNDQKIDGSMSMRDGWNISMCMLHADTSTRRDDRAFESWLTNHLKNSSTQPARIEWTTFLLRIGKPNLFIRFIHIWLCYRHTATLLPKP